LRAADARPPTELAVNDLVTVRRNDWRAAAATTTATSAAPSTAPCRRGSRRRAVWWRSAATTTPTTTTAVQAIDVNAHLLRLELHV
jgi:hypothetical protein